MPYQTPLRAGDPRRVGRYHLAGRLEGIPTDDPIFVATGADGAPVAISLLHSNWAQDAAARDRFAAEAAVAKRVPPFCAARVLDAGVEGPDAYLISEYIPGRSLLELVTAEGVQRGAQLESIAIGMATGLASVHQAGLVHGNFGPEYVIMVEDGPLRVIEYGITPPYGSATPSADMLAWAQSVVFAAAGRPAASYADLNVLPEHLRELAEQCLVADPAERPAARVVVQHLLGDSNLPAGLLAEGSRRAVRPAMPVPEDYAGTSTPGHSGPGFAAAPEAAADWPSTRRSQPVAASRLARDPGHASTRHSHAGDPVGQRQQARPGQHPGHQGGGHKRTGRRTGLLVALGVVVLVVIGAVTLYLTSKHPASSAGTDTAANHGRTPTTSPSVTTVPVVPARFAGHWTGQVQQPPTDTYAVTVSLTNGATFGTVSYSASNFSCSGTLTLIRATASKLSMHQDISSGQCQNGQVTLAMTSSGSIAFSFRNKGPVVASGPLNRH